MTLDFTGGEMTFQFTHPGRGATCKSTLPYDQAEVSIHAPREGCDILYTEGSIY